MSNIHIANRSNRHKLRVVKTVDSEDALNEAIENGHAILVRKLERNSKLYSKRLLLRNYRTKRYEEVPSRTIYRQYGQDKLEFPESEWECVHRYEHYHRSRRANKSWAAYVIPTGPVIGERFYIEDVIEDIFIQEFWYSIISADDGEAIWNGTDLEIDHKLYEGFHLVG